MNTHRLKLTFTEELIRTPLIHEVTHRYNLITNLCQADITDGAKIGWVILDVSGDSKTIEEALGWLCDEGVEIEFMNVL